MKAWEAPPWTMGLGMVSKRVSVKLLGAFKKAYGKEQVLLELKRNEKLRDVVQRLADASEDLRRALVDPELEDPRPNAIILVNGREIGLLQGLETEVGDNDEVAFIPVIHGG